EAPGGEKGKRLLRRQQKGGGEREEAAKSVIRERGVRHACFPVAFRRNLAEICGSHAGLSAVVTRRPGCPILLAWPSNRSPMLARRLAVAIALIAGLEFAQQYRQRIGGALDELRRIVAEFDAEAV